jgi:hypothetical protein
MAFLRAMWRWGQKASMGGCSPGRAIGRHRKSLELRPKFFIWPEKSLKVF